MGFEPDVFLQVVHDFDFTAIKVDTDFGIRREDYPSRLEWIKARLDRFKLRGYSGAALNSNFRGYFTPESMQELREAALYAKELGLTLWLYDEQYYPSGSAGGLTLKGHPELNNQALCCVLKDTAAEEGVLRVSSPHGHSGLVYAYAQALDGDGNPFGERLDLSECRDPAGSLCWDKPKGRWRVWSFFIRVLYEHTYLTQSFRATRRVPSVISESAIKRFLDVTFDPYKEALGDLLGTTVKAVFTDEPSLFWYRPYPKDRDPDKFRCEYPSVSVYDRPDLDIPAYPYIAWVPEFPAVFEEMHGYSLPERLPDLFAPVTDENRPLRLDFFRTVDELFDRAWTKQYSNRLGEMGIALSGHFIAEEECHEHPRFYGDILRGVGSEDIPGCDLLYSEKEHVRRSVAIRTAASAAHIYNKKHVMIEASSMFDENQALTPEFMMQAASMMFSLGADTLCSYYGENLFPDEDYLRYTDCLKRLRTLTEGGVHRTDGLLLYPFEGFCSECEVFAAELLPTRGGNENTALQDIRKSYEEMTDRLADAQYAFDLVDLRLLKQLEFADGSIRLASGDRPHTLILPRLTRLDGGLDEVLRRAVEAGVEVCMDGEPIAFPGAEGIRFLGGGIPGAGRIHTADSVPMLNLIRFEHEDCDILLVVNTDEPSIETELILPEKGCYKAVDPYDGAVIGEGAFDGRIPLKLDGLRAVLLTLKY